LNVVVLYFVYIFCFVWYETVFISTHSCFINKKIWYFHSVKNSFPRLINILFTFVIKCKLDLVNSVAYSEPWIYYTFNNCHHFFVWGFLLSIVKGGNWNEYMSKCLLSKNEIIHGKTQSQIGIHSYLVEDMVKLFLLVLVENVSVLWLVCHIQLQIISRFDICQHLIIIHLAFNHREHTITNAHYWEMLIWFFIKCLSPKQDFLDLLGIWKISVGDKGLKIARNIQTI